MLSKLIGDRAVRPRLGLGFKVLVLVLAVMIVGELASSILVLSLQRQQLIENAETAAAQLGDVVVASLEHAMMSDDRALAGQIVGAAVAEGKLASIRIIDRDGAVKVAAGSSDVGERFVYGNPECQFCHNDGPKPSSRSAIIQTGSGREALVSVNVITNRAACASCHKSETQALGLLLLEMPLVQLQGQLAAGLTRMAAAGLVTLVVLVTLVALAVRYLVSRPVGALVKSVSLIAAGDLDGRVEVASGDELGALAESFESMREKLKASRTEMERRNQELSVLNEVAQAASQLTDVEALLDRVLQLVVDRLGLQSATIHVLDEGSGRLVLRAWRGMTEEQRAEIERDRLKPGRDLSHMVATTGEAVFIPNMANDPGMQGRWPDLEGRSYINVPLRAKGRVVGTMGLVTYAGQTLDWRGVEVIKAVGHEIGIGLDNAILVSETMRNEREATTLYQLGTEVTDSLDLGNVLDTVADGVRSLLGADIGIVGLADEQREAIVVQAASGVQTDALRGAAFSVRKDSTGRELAAGRPLVMSDYVSAAVPADRSDPLVAEGASSFVAVPLRHADRILGLVGAISRTPRHFADGDVHLLTRLAHQVAVAVENAQLYHQTRRLVTLEERERLARELHDELAQSLAFLNIKASLLGEQLSKGEVAEALASLPELKRVAQETYTDVREAIFGLHGAPSDEAGLLPSLEQYLEEYGRIYGLEARLLVDRSFPYRFPPDVDAQLFRIIQEALSNVRKHSCSSRALVRFGREGDCVCISIEDAGRGFDPAQLTGEGSRYFGLQIMRERAESVGANLDLESWPGRGTRVTIRLRSTLGGWIT